MAGIKKVIGTTPNGKDIELVSNDFGHFDLQFKGGGQLPEKLQGKWTVPSAARDAVNDYLSGLKAKDNGKKAS